MSDIHVRNNLDAPHAGKDSPLYRMIASKTGTTSLPNLDVLDYASLWSADWWGLESSSVFANLSFEKQNDVLARCNKSLLTEAYFIEKSGLAYSAKMVLTAKNTDEAQLFALIGADEAKHLAWVEPYLSADAKQLPHGHFLSFLSNLIEEYPPRLLVYLVQIILEGWGLDHYSRLAKSCMQPELSKIFAAILKDEALHHKSGAVLFDATQLSRRDFSLIEDALQHYSLMVRVGPQAALSAVDAVAGGLSEDELQEVLVALRHQDETPRKLSLLKQLMSQPLVDQVVETLDAEHCFLPVSLREAVDCFVSSR
ncbi:MAG: ferritin-like domain-containing protein [Candidatus Melainabacteria bacterium]|nr:ferritin-like domain-containing protein [Candidatus Melainabacteria bacterium]